jgi:hypothetical protein
LIEPLSEKYLKKLLKKLTGNNDIEDALKRLDRLTQEESRMASAQLMKVTNIINNRVEEIADNMLGVYNRAAREVIQQAADGVDQMECLWFRTAFMLDMQAQLSSQGVGYDRIFVDGSRHQIHLPITISRVTPITREQRPGFSKERHTRNGSQQAPSRYSGFVENVCLIPFRCPTPPNNDSFVAGSGKSILWSVEHLLFL